MIQKTTKIICDNCGQGIYDYSNIPIRQCLKHLKEENLAYVVYTNGGRHEFCDKKCYKEWKERNAKR